MFEKIISSASPQSLYIWSNITVAVVTAVISLWDIHNNRRLENIENPTKLQECLPVIKLLIVVSLAITIFYFAFLKTAFPKMVSLYSMSATEDIVHKRTFYWLLGRITNRNPYAMAILAMVITAIVVLAQIDTWYFTRKAKSDSRKGFVDVSSIMCFIIILPIYIAVVEAIAKLLCL